MYHSIVTILAFSLGSLQYVDCQKRKCSPGECQQRCSKGEPSSDQSVIISISSVGGILFFAIIIAMILFTRSRRSVETRIQSKHQSKEANHKSSSFNEYTTSYPSSNKADNRQWSECQNDTDYEELNYYELEKNIVCDQSNTTANYYLTPYTLKKPADMPCKSSKDC